MRLLSKLVLGALSIALVYATAVPFIHTNAWWVRIFDFPRLQFAVLMALVLAAYLVLRLFYTRFRLWEYLLPALVAACLGWQLYSIAPYTPLVPHQVGDSHTDEEASRISVLVVNVLYDNREVDALLDLIRDVDPDVILLSEPTKWWEEQLEGLKEDYSHTVFQAQENQYGMLLYSRLELVEPEVRFLVEPNIPSIRTGIRLRSGKEVTFYGVHPRPPGLKPPGETDRTDSEQRDAELLLVAREVDSLDGEPVMVAGDFNDVAWSRTTHRFQRIGGLLDPRVGRGLYNTYDAHSPVLRYPLDHVFVSDDFRVVELRRLRKIGSDHFPMLAVLDYDPGAAVAQDEPQADADDQEEADEAIEDAR